MADQNKGLVQNVKDRNELMSQLINENGTLAPTPSPSPTPQPKTFGQMLAHLLGLGG